MYVIEDERKIFTVASAPSSIRWVYTCYEVYSETLIMPVSQLTVDTIRTVYYEPPFHYSERQIYIDAYLGLSSSNRFYYTPEGDFPEGFRWCTYIPGAQVIFLTVPTSSIKLYASDRSVFGGNFPVTQRYICAPYTTLSERKTSVSLEDVKIVHSFEAHSLVTSFSERSVQACVGSFCQFYVVVPHVEYDERKTSCLIVQERSIHAPVVSVSIGGIYTERTIACHSLATYTERICLIVNSPFTERYMCYRLRTWNDRSCMFVVSSSNYYHSFVVIPAIPKYSERVCIVLIIDYSTKRFSFVETKSLYVSKNPITMSSPLIVKSLQDDDINIQISSDRHLETQSLVSEEQQDVDWFKVKLTSADETFTASTTDNSGAKLSSDSNIEKTCEHSSKFILNLTIKDEIHLATNWRITHEVLCSTAWKIENAPYCLTSWQIEVEKYDSTSWQITNGIYCSTSWQIIKEKHNSISWKIKNEIYCSTSWQILN